MRNFLTQLSVLFLAILLLSFNAYASEEVPMADTFRKEGKIYVVVGVFVMIMAGILILLIALERRLGKIEQQLKQDSEK